MPSIKSRLKKMAKNGRAEDVGHHDGVAYNVDDPTGEDPKGIGIIVLDDDTVIVHDWHGSGQIGGESKAVEILDDLDRRRRKERKPRSSMGKRRRGF